MERLQIKVRRFMTASYILAITGGIASGLAPLNWWSVLLVPLATAFLLFIASLVNIWVEHRYAIYPFERNAQITLEANKALSKEIDQLRQEELSLIKEVKSLREKIRQLKKELRRLLASQED